MNDHNVIRPVVVEAAVVYPSCSLESRPPHVVVKKVVETPVVETPVAVEEPTPIWCGGRFRRRRDGKSVWVEEPEFDPYAAATQARRVARKAELLASLPTGIPEVFIKSPDLSFKIEDAELTRLHVDSYYGHVHSKGTTDMHGGKPFFFPSTHALEGLSSPNDDYLDMQVVNAYSFEDKYQYVLQPNENREALILAFYSLAHKQLSGELVLSGRLHGLKWEPKVVEMYLKLEGKDGSEELMPISLTRLTKVTGFSFRKFSIYEAFEFDRRALLSIRDRETVKAWDAITKGDLKTQLELEELLISNLVDLAYYKHIGVPPEEEKAQASDARIFVGNASLPKWYVHFQQHQFYHLRRKRAVVAYVNDYLHRSKLMAATEGWAQGAGMPPLKDLKSHWKGYSIDKFSVEKKVVDDREISLVGLDELIVASKRIGYAEADLNDRELKDTKNKQARLAKALKSVREKIGDVPADARVINADSKELGIACRAKIAARGSVKVATDMVDFVAVKGRGRVLNEKQSLAKEALLTKLCQLLVVVKTRCFHEQHPMVADVLSLCNAFRASLAETVEVKEQEVVQQEIHTQVKEQEVVQAPTVVSNKEVVKVRPELPRLDDATEALLKEVEESLRTPPNDLTKDTAYIKLMGDMERESAEEAQREAYYYSQGIVVVEEDYDETTVKSTVPAIKRVLPLPKPKVKPAVVTLEPTPVVVTPEPVFAVEPTSTSEPIVTQEPTPTHVEPTPTHVEPTLPSVEPAPVIVGVTTAPEPQISLSGITIQVAVGVGCVVEIEQKTSNKLVISVTAAPTPVTPAVVSAPVPPAPVVPEEPTPVHVTPTVVVEPAVEVTQSSAELFPTPIVFKEETVVPSTPTIAPSRVVLYEEVGDDFGFEDAPDEDFIESGQQSDDREPPDAELPVTPRESPAELEEILDMLNPTPAGYHLEFDDEC